MKRINDVMNKTNREQTDVCINDGFIFTSFAEDQSPVRIVSRASKPAMRQIHLHRIHYHGVPPLLIATK